MCSNIILYCLTELQALTAAIAAVELAVLIVGLLAAQHQDTLSIASNAVPFVASLAVCQLSYLEHGRSVKPSTLLISYLLASIICDGVLLHLQLQESFASPHLLSAALTLKLLLLILESINKHSYLRDPFKCLPIEQTVSDLNRTFLFWINDLILLGRSKILIYQDLPEVSEDLKSWGLRMQMEDRWAAAGKSCAHTP